MDDKSRFDFSRGSLECSGVNEDEKDLMAEYFKIRLGNTKVSLDARQSSLDVLDIDTMSLLDEGRKVSLASEANFKKAANPSEKPGVPEDERQLAMKALQRLKHKETMRDSALDVAELLKEVNISGAEGDDGGSERKTLPHEWYGWTSGADSPRVFQDELSSTALGTSSDTFSKQKSIGGNRFETQTKEEMSEWLAKEEKKFLAEQPGLLHDSQITHFSGVSGQCAPNAPNRSEEQGRTSDMSIGQFFGQRSARVGSLIGERLEDDISINFADLPSSTLAPTADIASPRQPSAVPTSDRNSNESNISNSTVNIKQLLAAMDAGLSGDEICQRLLAGTKNRNKMDVPPRTESLDASGFHNFRDLSNCRKSTPVVHRSKRRLPESKENKDPLRGIVFSTPKVEPKEKQREWCAPNQSHVPVESSILSKSSKQDTVVTITLEDTLAAGDLTLLQDRIDELKEESVILGQPTQATQAAQTSQLDLLAVIQHLASRPPGTVDCSALSPLLRDQFPEVYSAWSASLGAALTDSEAQPDLSGAEHPVLSDPDSWVKLPVKVGYRKKINACADVEKVISIPVVNVTKQYLLVSLSAVSIRHSSGKVLQASQDSAGQWLVQTFLVVSLKDTVLVPDSENQQLKVRVVVRVPASLIIPLTLVCKDLLTGATRTRHISLGVSGINPVKTFSVMPNDVLDFGTMPELCRDVRTLRVQFDGACDLPLVFRVREPADHFSLTSNVTLNGKPLEDATWKAGQLQCTLAEGQQHTLELSIEFNSGSVGTGPSVVDVSTYLEVDLAECLPDHGGPLHLLTLNGGVAFTKFLCDPSCRPILLHSPALGQPVSRWFPLKNISAVPIDLTLKVLKEDMSECKDSLFIVPPRVRLGKDSDAGVKVTFTGATHELKVKRILLMEVFPNGVQYTEELVGVVKADDSRPSSRASNHTVASRCSAVTSSTSAQDAVTIHLQTSSRALSWPAVPLQTAIKKTLYLRNSSAVKTTARMSFKREDDAFKIVNDDGECLDKLRRMLKPNVDCPVVIVFKPDAIGVHKNALIIETNKGTSVKMIKLNGYGGAPKMFLRNIPTDLYGHRVVRMERDSQEGTTYTSHVMVTNQGNTAGFVAIRCASHGLVTLKDPFVANPSCAVLAPGAQVRIDLMQRLGHNDARCLFATQDVIKVATFTFIMGDEPTRQRLRRVKPRSAAPSSLVAELVGVFPGEREMDLARLEDDAQTLEDVFRSSLRTIDVNVVIERTGKQEDPTMLEEADFSVDAFNTVLTASDTIVPNTDASIEKMLKDVQRTPRTSFLPPKTEPAQTPLSSRQNVIKWLDTNP